MKKISLYRHMHPISAIDKLKPSMFIMLFPVIQQILLNPKNTIVIAASLSLDALYALLLAVYSFFTYRSRTYRIRSNSIIMKKGLLFRKHYLLPMKNIQTIILYESLFLSLFGAVRIFFDTSGGGRSKSDMNLCISKKTASAIKKIVSAEKTFICHGKGFYIILMSVIWANPLSGFLWLLPAISEMGKIFGFNAMQAYHSVDIPLLRYLTFIDPMTKTLVTLLLIGWAGSIIIQLFRYAGFECSRENNRIVITRGIPGKTTVYTDLNSISAWIEESSLLMNFLGLKSCSVCTAGIGKMKGDKSLLLPAADKYKTRKQMELLCGESLPENVSIRPQKNGIVRYLTMPVIILIICIISIFWLSARFTIFSKLRSIYFIIIIAASWWCLFRIYAFRHCGITMENNFICASVFKGLRMKKYYIPKNKSAYFRLSQNPLQKFNGLCDLSIYIAYETKLKITVCQLSAADVSEFLYQFRNSAHLLP